MFFNTAHAAAGHDDTHYMLQLLRAERYADAATYKAAYRQIQTVAPLLHGDSNTYQTAVYYGTLLIKTMPVIWWQLLLLLSWYAFCFCFLYAVRYRRRLLLLWGILVAISLMPVAFGYYTDKQRALVVASSADIYNGPNKALYKIGTLPRNVLVQLADEKKGWYKIKHNATIGWVESASVEKI
jgi:hypothetical protein